MGTASVFLVGWHSRSCLSTTNVFDTLLLITCTPLSHVICLHAISFLSRLLFLISVFSPVHSSFSVLPCTHNFILFSLSLSVFSSSNAFPFLFTPCHHLITSSSFSSSSVLQHTASSSPETHRPFCHLCSSFVHLIYFYNHPTFPSPPLQLLSLFTFVLVVLFLLLLLR